MNKLNFYLDIDKIKIVPPKFSLKINESCKFKIISSLKDIEKEEDLKSIILKCDGVTIKGNTLRAVSSGDYKLTAMAYVSKDKEIHTEADVNIQSFFKTVDSLSSLKDKNKYKKDIKQGFFSKTVEKTYKGTIRTIRIFGYNIDIVWLALALIAIGTATNTNDIMMRYLSYFASFIFSLLKIISDKGTISKKITESIKKPLAEVDGYGFTIEKKDLK